MSGYDWNQGMSNRAVTAYDNGLMPASKIATALRARGYRVTGEWVKTHFTPAEWHHTSAKFNATNFYDLAQIEAQIAANADRFESLAAEFAMAAKATKKEESYLADVVVTDWIEERVHQGYFRGRSRGMRSVNRPHLRTLISVRVSPSGATMIEIEGEGRRKSANCIITRLDTAEIKRRKNVASAAKRKATIAAKAAMAKASAAIAAAMKSPMLALPAPARRIEPLENQGKDFVRRFLAARYHGGIHFCSGQRGQIHSIAQRAAAKIISLDAAMEQVDALVKTWAVAA